MKAKDLITRTSVTEAEGGLPASAYERGGAPPPGREFPEMEPMTRRPGKPMRGGPSEPAGQFSGKEYDQLKDLMMLMLAHVMQSDMDKAIAFKIMKRQPLEPGEMAHLMDEAGRMNDLPETHRGLMQKLFTMSQG